jgi:hypothetical protein
MRILYVPNHGVLEYDELRIFSTFATSVFSAWFYVDPAKPSSDVRPALPDVPRNHEAEAMWAREGLTRETCLLSADFLRCFDVVVAVHDNRGLDYLASVTTLPVFLRMIGQTREMQEAKLATLRPRFRIVRYSPAERHIPNYAGEDALIRFGKFMEDFGPWTGEDRQVISFYGSISRRKAAAHFDFYDAATRPFSRTMYGNTETGWSVGRVAAAAMRDVYRAAYVYFCLHTNPASYTLNLIEAMASGCPIVTPGRSVIASLRGTAPLSYEVPDLIDGCVDVPEEAHRLIRALFGTPSLAREHSERNRATAIELFSAAPVAAQWKTVLEGRVRRRCR